MISQKQIKQWIPDAVSIFQEHMHISDAPPIYVAGPKTVLSKREAIADELHSKEHLKPNMQYDSMMEMIHGELGDAILINQKLLDLNASDPVQDFNHYLWHELGHYFAIKNECASEDLHRYNDSDLLGSISDDDEEEVSEEWKSNKAKQHGYWFWNQFIAECIAIYVDERQNPFSEPTEWTTDVWYPSARCLSFFINVAFQPCGFFFDLVALAMYFAHLLMSEKTKQYIQAAYAGKLILNLPEGSQQLDPSGMDPTCISVTEEFFQETLLEMKEILEQQISKERFWEIDANLLEVIGQCILQLQEPDDDDEDEWVIVDSQASDDDDDDDYYEEQRIVLSAEQVEAIIKSINNKG